MARELRPYQVEAVEAVEAEWDSGLERTSVILPTGSGKSSVIAALAARARSRGERVVMLAHRSELLDQMAETVGLVDPGGEEVGKVIATTDEPDAEIVAASFQTLARSPERVAALGRRDVILVDEAHHSSAPTYLRVLAELGLSLDPDADLRSARESDVVRHDSRPETVACGFTATMSRADSVKLGNIWSSVAFERDLVWGIENGYLIKPTGRTVRLPELNRLNKIATVAGDYHRGQLDEVMRASVETTVDAIATHARGRALIVFAASVEHADALADGLTDIGIKAAAVVGSHTKAEREVAYTAYRAGEIDALVTVQVLTEGADFPRCDAVVLARPTRSEVLYCFDSETEILTPNGWVRGDELAEDTQVAAYNMEDGTVDWSVPIAYVNRPLEPGEEMVGIESPTVSMRVTGNHQVVYRGKGTPGWQKKEAADLLTRRTGFDIPAAGMQHAPGVELSDDEIALVAWAMSDGGINKHTGQLSIYQQTPEYLPVIESMLDGCGIKWRKSVLAGPTNFGPRKNPLHVYRASRGKPRVSDKHLTGWGHLSPAIPKDHPEGSPERAATYARLDAMDADQFRHFLTHLHYANGSEQAGQSWTRRTFHISTPDLEFAEWVQSLCARRGWRANVAAWESGRDKPLYAIHCREVPYRSVGGSGQTDREHLTIAETVEGEKVWCVQVPTGAVVVRRKGKVFVSGNSQIVGRSVRPYTDPETGAEKKDALVIDLTGVARDNRLRTLTDLWGEADTREFDGDGEEILPPPPPPPEGRPETAERTGRVELEDIDLLADPGMVVLRSNAGVVFVPSMGKDAYVLWPPNPFEAENVYLVRLGEGNTVEFWRDQNGTGRAIPDTAANMLTLARRLAGNAGTFIAEGDPSRSPKVRPTAKQKDLAIRLNLNITPAMSRAEVSDAITAFFTEKTLLRNMYRLRAEGIA